VVLKRPANIAIDVLLTPEAKTDKQDIIRGQIQGVLAA
jgi:hypothetical protein